jgi:hypothetical protein
VRKRLPKETKRLYISWFKECAADEKAARIKTLQNSKPGFAILHDILNRKYVAASITPEDYKDPSWAYKMADVTGYQRALEDVMILLENVDDVDPTIEKED